MKDTVLYTWKFVGADLILSAFPIKQKKKLHGKKAEASRRKIWIMNKFLTLTADYADIRLSLDTPSCLH